MLTFSGYMYNITIYIDIYYRILLVSVSSVVYLIHSLHQVWVATHSRLNEHAKVAGSQRRTCINKKQNSYFDKNHALLTVNMTVYQV